MNTCHHRSLRQGIAGAITGGLALLVLAAVPMSAQAAACTQTVTGANTAVINVAAGQKVCLRNATQIGAINVAATGGLSIRKSTVTGALSLAGQQDFVICGSTVVGAISASGGLAPISIGGTGPPAGCAGNTITGAVALAANTAGVTLARSSITGAVAVSGNLDETTIAGNKISGALACTTNVPAPVNAGLTNVVGGARSGQTCVDAGF